MSPWFTKNLGDATLALGALDRVEALFRSIHGEAQGPGEAAIFFRHESEGHLHCDLRVYLSPAAEAAARAAGAEPCDRPAREGLSLLAGPESAWRALFPEGPGTP